VGNVFSGHNPELYLAGGDIMPYHDHPDEVEDPRMIIAELRGVVRRQRVIIVLCLIVITLMSVKVWLLD